MLMFKRSQLYIGLALAGLAEIIVRAVAHKSSTSLSRMRGLR